MITSMVYSIKFYNFTCIYFDPLDLSLQYKNKMKISCVLLATLLYRLKKLLFTDKVSE